MKYVVPILLVLAMGGSSSCATTHAVRYAYHAESFYGEAVTPEDHQYSFERITRIVIALPLIVSAVGWDAGTFPLQALFGAWPWWGDSSLCMRPGVDER